MSYSECSYLIKILLELDMHFHSSSTSCPLVSEVLHVCPLFELSCFYMTIYPRGIYSLSRNMHYSYHTVYHSLFRSVAHYTADPVVH